MLENLPPAVLDGILYQLPGVNRRRLGLASRRMAALVYRHEKDKTTAEVLIGMSTDENLHISYDFCLIFPAKKSSHLAVTRLHQALPFLNHYKITKVDLSFNYVLESFAQVVDKLDVEPFVGTFLPFHLMEMLQIVKESTFLGSTRDVVVNVDYDRSPHTPFLDREFVDKHLALIGKRPNQNFPMPKPEHRWGKKLINSENS